MTLSVYQVDAFTDTLFGGNPAAVVLLPSELSESTLQSIAAEHNLSETAFVLPEEQHYRLRWFTPVLEVDLCGHATLASAFVLFETGLATEDSIRFETKSGSLFVTRDADLMRMDFPSRPPEPASCTDALVDALGARPSEVHGSRDLMAVFDSEEQVRRLQPDFAKIAALDAFAVAVTAPGREVDFVSRFFAPKAGVAEDPVTGSAHCTLVPYWARQLAKRELHARQVSARGGELFCTDRGDRVSIGGRAVMYLRGQIEVT
ncbi:MAG: PhzF family phenazine biosynthesis protein [Acidobacteriota bacterium]|nr:MAG: PhzF family phenazine biosynthesis protein [Acidobacteriota bacterium]